MAIIELLIPKMGESIHEATVINWLKKEGDIIEEDETILEIATDKVDSEVPSPVKGTLHKILAQVDDVIPVGQAVALISTQGDYTQPATSSPVEPAIVEQAPQLEEHIAASTDSTITIEPAPAPLPKPVVTTTKRFYTPLVKTIARQEEISISELETITGTGPKNRVTKEDLFRYVTQRNLGQSQSITHPVLSDRQDRPVPSHTPTVASQQKRVTKESVKSATTGNQGATQSEEVIELDRMRKMIAKHMIHSRQTSAHVSSFVEADVTKMVMWRNKIKNDYITKYGERLTFSPLFAEAVIRALQDFPTINASLRDDQLILKKHINLGIATALPDGNLIVPVIQAAEKLNLLGLTEKLNDLARRARDNKLKPDEIQGGTFTISNIGTFGNLMGTPIINQPQLAILAIGAIKKKPVIMETEHGDIIAIRHMMFLSLSFDHRVIDGFLGGSFLNRVAENIEKFDSNRQI